MRSWVSLLFFVLLVVAGGLTAGMAAMPDAWYAGLTKPPFNPPNWIFGPVWTALYVMIGIAGWRIWRVDRNATAMKFWWAQLILNFVWSPAFFGLHLVWLALAIILLMLGAIIGFIVAAFKIDRLAAWLFVPYAAWVSFASLLNASIFVLN